MKKLLLICFVFFVALISSAQMPGTFQPVLIGAEACAYPLDAISASAAGAYSTARKLRSAYAGNAFTITRASDSTTQAVGFSGCDVNQSTISTFCSGTTCSITTLNDQSSNARDFTQGTLALAPVIYTSGAVVASINSKLTMRFNGTTQFLTRAATAEIFFASGAASTVFSAARVTAVPVTTTNINDSGLIIGAYDNSSGNDFGVGYDSSGGTPRLVAGTPNGILALNISALPVNVMGLMRTSALTSGTAGKVYANGGTPTTGNWSNSSTQTGNVAMGKSTRAFLGADVPEIIVFTSQLSQADSNLLGNNEATYYALTWTNI